MARYPHLDSSGLADLKRAQISAIRSINLNMNIDDCGGCNKAAGLSERKKTRVRLGAEPVGAQC